MAIERIVYIVDDSADYLLLLEQVFAHFIPNCTARFFSSGDALYKCIQTEGNRPDLVLMDLNMPPGMSGCETLVLLRQYPHWQRVPVVMMSNDGSEKEIAQCYEAGTNSFLNKPMGLAEMKHLMKTICHYWLDLNRLPRE